MKAEPSTTGARAAGNYAGLLLSPSVYIENHQESTGVEMMETHGRSMTKSIVWRMLGVFVLATITYIYTRSWIQSTLITIFHHGAFIAIYYLHERAWLKVRRFIGLKRKILRAFTYEIILGHVVLGLISLGITGSWMQVTLITITYIENKLWMYVVYDWLWDKTSWKTLQQHARTPHASEIT